MRRRVFVASALGIGATLGVRRVLAQGGNQQSSASNVTMNQEAAQTVRRPPKPGARPQLSNDQRDELEHHIRCQCGCTLDVYTCRTTDFACQVSPAMHADVIALVEGGYTAQEILDSFVDTYGERALMAPKAEGFNLLGYVAPFIALGAGAVAVVAVLRTWGSRSSQASAPLPAVDATPDELARLDAAIRDEH